MLSFGNNIVSSLCHFKLMTYWPLWEEPSLREQPEIPEKRNALIRYKKIFRGGSLKKQQRFLNLALLSWSTAGSRSGLITIFLRQDCVFFCLTALSHVYLIFFLANNSDKALTHKALCLDRYNFWKVMMVTETVYEDQVVCDHSYDRRCHMTTTTKFQVHAI